MELENIGRMSYQGSATASAAPSATVATPKDEAPVLETVGSGVQNFSTDTSEENDTTQSEKKVAQNAQLKKAVEDLNRQMKDSVAIFGIHEKTNRVTIKIVDKNTDEVIKEYPPEETLDMIAKVWEIAGILVDEKR